MRPDWYFLIIYGFLKLIPGDLSFSIFGGKITPETIGGVIFPTFLILVFALIPIIDRSKEPQHYISNPLHRPFMTAFGITGGVFLSMLVVSGYIDVLKIAPHRMIMYVIVATAITWVVSYTLLKLYNKNKNGGNNV